MNTKKEINVAGKHLKTAFTLAEVLITLVVVGVVAALTIPSLMALIGTKVTENQTKVFQAKLIQGLNLAKTSGDLANNFTSTEDFLRNGLARHYKMVAICGANNLRDCIPYDEIAYMDGDEEKTVKVADLKTAKSIKIEKDGFEDTAAFITADGIPVIMTYDKKCIVDTEQADREISSCVAGIYDLNGPKNPNKYAFTLNDDGETIKAYTYDIRTFNGAGIGKTNLFDFEIVVKAFKPEDIYGTEGVGSPTFEDSYASYGCNTCPDYWQAAKTYCENNDANLPTPEQLTSIAKVLYQDNDIELVPDEPNYWQSGNHGLHNIAKDAVFETLGISINTRVFELWSNTPSSNNIDAWYRQFGADSTGMSNDDGRCTTHVDAICVK